MLVREVMTREVVTCDADETIATAAKRMLDEGIGSVLVTTGGDPVAIVTETDVLRAGAITGEPLGEIPIRPVASHPLITVAESATVRTAVARMVERDVKKLPVVDGTDLVGILTRSDIVAHHSDFIKEAHQLDAMSDRWESGDG
ncbi:CBS domain-containing protein (plasmid) [Halobaculum sp. CBA1158]|uniref:CBS domain-containing protein n=1 Tax=Halobaculum sp. CBA1158 TaxID=2904243 RepID=UPI001F1CE2CA|nr:CBS domain-containing protein [Halobaculum sp. CBA1158]UIP01383.1 CBS domain-containing protein [Halobaculum sp. CBA1158]